MFVHIHDSLTISDLQERFSMCFPSLKLEFCKKKHQWEEICSFNQLFPPHMLIGAIRKQHNNGALELKSWHKVGEAEKAFYDEFGLNVQICYRNGDRWIQSGKSDNITIGELQERAYTRPRRVLL